MNCWKLSFDVMASFTRLCACFECAEICGAYVCSSSASSSCSRRMRSLRAFVAMYFMCICAGVAD